jgi:hypothetical protein
MTSAKVPLAAGVDHGLPCMIVLSPGTTGRDGQRRHMSATENTAHQGTAVKVVMPSATAEYGDPGLSYDVPGMNMARPLLLAAVIGHLDYVRGVLAQIDADEAHRAATGDEYLITHAPVPPGMPEVFADALESWIFENESAARELVFRLDLEQMAA